MILGKPSEGGRMRLTCTLALLSAAMIALSPTGAAESEDWPRRADDSLADTDRID